MKKMICLVMSLLMISSLITTALADGTTTLTTTVPSATYTLNIPADQEITFGTEQTMIDAPTVSDATGFAVGKNLNVTVTCTDFTCQGTSTKIPVELKGHYEVDGNPSNNYNKSIASNSDLCFDGLSDGTVRSVVREYKAAAEPSNSNYYNLCKLVVCVLSADWGKALAGDYSATITFTSKIVVDSTT